MGKKETQKPKLTAKFLKNQIRQRFSRLGIERKDLAIQMDVRLPLPDNKRLPHTLRKAVRYYPGF